MQKTILKLALSASLLGACSGPQEVQDHVPCENQAQALEKTMSDVNMMLMGAGILIDLASRGDAGAIKQARELRPKVHQKLSDMKTQRAQVQQFCPEEYYMSSGQNGLKGTSRFDMQITSIRQMIENLKGYVDIDITLQ